MGAALLVGASVTPSRATQAPQRLAIWAEVSANLRALSSREGVAATLDRAKVAGVITIVPEVKNALGFVTYESTFARPISAPRLFCGQHHPIMLRPQYVVCERLRPIEGD